MTCKDCGCGCNCKCHERYEVSNEFYIVDHSDNTHLTLVDACAVLNDKDRVIKDLFRALSAKCGDKK